MNTITIRTGNGIENVKGYIVKDFGVHRSNTSKGWNVTDLKTGMKVNKVPYATLKGAKSVGIDEAEKTLTAYKVAKLDTYNELVNAFNKAIGKDDKESEGKKMTKTTKTNAKANTKASKAKASTKAKSDNSKALEKKNKALEKEIEILKKQIEELTRVEKTTIDTFDVEAYMASRNDTDRITAELVEALENTKGLTVTRKGEDGWVYVQGKTEADTKERREIFKAMGFRWSGKQSAWYLAPYPLANGKRYAARKARKANANA